MPTPTVTSPGTGRVLTDDERRRFDEQGFLHVPHALSDALLDRLRAAVADVYAEERRAGRVGDAGSLHLLGFVGRRPEFLELLDLETTFPLVWGLLGWNIYLYHSHLDVHPPVPDGEANGWGWHQDGGRQNLELETDPRPRLSVKVAFWLSDVSEPGRGNTLVIPGSHWRNTLRRPHGEASSRACPAGAIELLVEPGDAVVLDRLLWHSRSPNRSPLTRRALFLAYTYRWVRERDDPAFGPWVQAASLSPIRRQLLGAGADAPSYWGLGDDVVPLRAHLSARGLLDPQRPSHR